MNILSSEQMNEVEQLFATKPIQLIYKLRLPTEREYQNMAAFQTHIFPVAGQAAQKATQKMITLSDNMRGLSQYQPNSVFHMLTYTLINILYQDKYSATIDTQNNYFLMETIKCSLYSKDVDLQRIKNVPTNYDSTQLKLMAFHFFSFMEQPSLCIKTNRNKCALWILTHNPMLLLAFNLFLRFVLAKLGIEEADDYRKCVSNSEATTNLIQYFDLHYRNLGELILLYQDGIFLAIIEKEIVVGEYYQNQNEKQTQKQQLQIKSSVKLNMIESFLVNVNDKADKSEPIKKKGIVESDMKLFNFMLESGSEDGNDQQIIKREREMEMETPHFKDGGEQFHFLRKKKSGEFKPEEIRNQFQRLIMDESQEYNEDQDIAPTPYLGGENQFTFTANFGNKQLNSAQVIDSPIDELTDVQNCQNPFKETSRHSVEHGGLRRTTEQNEKYLKMYTGVPQAMQGKQMFASLSTDQCFFTSNVDRREPTIEWSEMAHCSCRRSKFMRNGMDSKVVEVSILPQKNCNRQNYLSHVVMPKCLNNYRPNKQSKQRQEQLNRQRAKQTNRIQQKPYMDRKPAFLKNLKKNKHQNTEHDFTKSLVNQSKKYQTNIQKQVSQERFKFNTLNTLEEIPDSHVMRSTPKQYHQYKSVKTESDVGDREKRNEQMDNISTYRSGIINAWQTNSNFMQKVPQYNKISKVKTSQMSTPNAGVSSTSPLKFYAPVQIIAPTVYLNSNANNNGNIVFRLNDINNKTQVNPQAKASEKQYTNKEQVKSGLFNCRQF